MKLPFKKTDPTVEALANVEKFGDQLAKLATRRSDMSLRLEEARAARRAALISGELGDEAQAAVDKAFADAAEAVGFVEGEITTITGKRDAAQQHLDGLRDASRRAEVSADCERRISALDQAAENLAGAAEALGAARIAMALTIEEHGVRVPSPSGADGNAPVWQIAQPVVQAAIRLAAPGVLPVADSLGVAHTDDPLVAMRALSDKLRFHAEDVMHGRTPAVAMPRPGSTAPAVPTPGPRGSDSPVPAGLAVTETLTRTVFAVPAVFIGVDGVTTVSVPPGDAEVSVRVARKAEELELSFSPDSPEGRAIVAKLKASGGQYRARPPVFIDTSGDADPLPAPLGRTITTTWPDERDTGRRA